MNATPGAEQTRDKYVFVRQLAKGGMAEVWLARERLGGSERAIVLKIPLPEFAEDPDFVKMFLDEARLASLLHHPNIVSIYDVGRLGERYFISMEYVAGKTLRQLLHQLRRDDRRLPVWFALAVAIKTCEALDHAHHARDEGGWPLSIVHRDVSPENVMVGYDGSVKVLDFGIAKASARGTRTRVGAMKGKHAYMAPEQILAAETGCEVDQRADLYSLGVVLYELLTTVRAFDADNELSLIRSIVEGAPQPEPPCSLAPWLPPEVESAVLRAMARAPEERFATAADLRACLLGCLRLIGQSPSDRHIGGMLSLILPRAPDSMADDRTVPSAAPASEAPRAASQGSEAAAGKSGSWPAMGTTEDRRAADLDDEEESFLFDPTTLAGWERSEAPSSERPARTVQPGGHCWDRVLERRNSEKHGTPEPPDDTTAQYSRPASGSFELSGPDRAKLEFELGVKLNREKDFQGALEALERAVVYDPTNRLYQTNLKLLRRKLDRA